MDPRNIPVSLFHNRLRGHAHQLQLRNNLANALQRHIFRKLGLNPTIIGTVLHLHPEKPGMKAQDGGGG